MREKHLNQMKIIECLINSREMTFEQLKAECGVKADTMHSRTLSRYLKELSEEKLIIRNNGKYHLNRERFLANNHGINDVWQKLLNCAIESGEIECYRNIKKFIKPEHQDNLLSDEALLRFRETVIENVRMLNDDERKIRLLKAAIQGENEIQMEHKGKRIQIVPLCIVTSRDGYRNYVFGLRRKRQMVIMELSQIHIVKFLDRNPVPDREEYLEKIRQSWDIDISESVHVKLLLRKDYDRERNLERQLKKYFGKPKECGDNKCVFEGELSGISDFKKWIREHMEAVCILEPKKIREELMEALTVKIGRYEQNG